MIFKLLFTLLSLLLAANSVDGHSRWQCPEPRSPDTGIKVGVCGEETNDFSGTPIAISPGPFTVKFEESIAHIGGPWRISLSQDGTDDGEACILLDHIPHNDNEFPLLPLPSSYTPYSITIEIPNVSCERCSLHLSNPMTDKIDEAGSPTGIGCTDPGTCFSVYHSCTKPLTITGSTKRSDYKCPQKNPTDWPTEWNGDDGMKVDASVLQVYRRESGFWLRGKLMNAPARYRASAGLICEETEQLTEPPVVTEPPAVPNEPGFCVSGSMEVELENGTLKSMDNLKVGDVVKVDNDIFEPIYAFGHHDQDVSVLNLRLAFRGYLKSLELSHDHMLFRKQIDGQFLSVPASVVKVGDELENGQIISSVTEIRSKGAYAPFTPSGTVIVNDVKISNYITMQSNESHLKFGGVVTPFGFHDLAHAFMTLHRRIGFTVGLHTIYPVARWCLSSMGNQWIKLIILTMFLIWTAILAVFDRIFSGNCFVLLVTFFIWMWWKRYQVKAFKN